jgi:hypothetical protein
MSDPYETFAKNSRVQYVNENKPALHGRCGEIIDWGGGAEFESFLVKWDEPVYHSHQNRESLMCRASNLRSI